jgi:DNA-binding MarR family transcriptional regulator
MVVDPVALADVWFRAHRRFDVVFRGHQGPSPTQLELFNLLSEAGTLSLMEAAGRMGVSGATLARAVDAAVRRGWIAKVRDPQDRRVVWLRNTEAGTREQEALRLLLANHLTRLLDGASSDDVSGLGRVLARVSGLQPAEEASVRLPR